MSPLFTGLLILSLLFVIWILFFVILFFFVVRSRIKVLSSSILLFAVCKSFRRFVFSSAIGVITFLIKSAISVVISFCHSWHLFVKCAISSSILLNAHFRLYISIVTVGVASFLGFLGCMLVFPFFAECKILSGDFFCGVNSTVFLSLLFWSYSGRVFEGVLHICTI